MELKLNNLLNYNPWLALVCPICKPSQYVAGSKTILLQGFLTFPSYPSFEEVVSVQEHNLIYVVTFEKFIKRWHGSIYGYVRKGAGQEGSPRVTSHTLRNVGDHEGMNLHCHNLSFGLTTKVRACKVVG
jgi:hypothetical protein